MFGIRKKLIGLFLLIGLFFAVCGFWYGHLHGVKDFGNTALSFGAADASKSFNLPTDINGILHEIDYSVPVWTNGPTMTVTIERADGSVAWTGTPRVKAGTVQWFAEFPDRAVVGGETIKVTLTAALPGGAGATVNVHCFGRGR